MFHNMKQIGKVATYIGGRHFGNPQKRDGTTYDESTTIFRVSDLYRFVKNFIRNAIAGCEISPLLENADGTPKALFDFLKNRSKLRGGHGIFQCICRFHRRAVQFRPFAEIEIAHPENHAVGVDLHLFAEAGALENGAVFVVRKIR